MWEGRELQAEKQGRIFADRAMVAIYAIYRGFSISKKSLVPLQFSLAVDGDATDISREKRYPTPYVVRIMQREARVGKNNAGVSRSRRRASERASEMDFREFPWDMGYGSAKGMRERGYGRETVRGYETTGEKVAAIRIK